MASTLIPATDLPVAVAHTPETSATAIAAREKASVEARFVVAQARPRNIDVARRKLLEACRRPRFAEVAEYSKPRAGKQIVGPSIRLAEEAARAYGNVDIRTPVIFDNDDKRIVKVVVTDLESNITFESDVTVEKVAERTQPRRGETVLETRPNSTGGTTYIVRATEDDFANKQAALVSKQLRGLLLRVVPSDLIEEAIDTARNTLRDADAKDPTAARKRMVDAFASVGVTPVQLAEWLGRPLDTIAPEDPVMRTLRQMYAAIKDGEATWADYASGKTGVVEGEPVARKKGAAGLKEKLATEPKAEPAPEPAPAAAQRPADYQDDSDLATD